MSVIFMPFILKILFLTLIVSAVSFCQNSYKDFCAMGDNDFLQMDYDNARRNYMKGLELNSDDYDLNWKLARLLVNLGEIPGNERQNYFEEAQRYAEKSMTINPNKNEGYTFAAAAIGNIAYYSGNKDKLNAANKMINLLNEAIKIDPQDHIALSILGSIERLFAGLNWLERSVGKIIYSIEIRKGSYDKSVEYFQKAIAIDNTLIRHRYELALTYLDMKDNEKARHQFEAVLKSPIQLKADYHRIELTKEKLKQIDK
jgi:tetratricopeptide (TPR) repeat protein